MPYVPPHKRVPAGDGKNHPCPEIMSSKNSSSSSASRPKLYIKNAVGLVRRLIVLSRPDVQLKFEPFQGTSYAHLQDCALHTVCIVQQEQAESSPELQASLAQFQDQLVEDFQAVITGVQSKMRPEECYIRPKFVLRFGKLFFHPALYRNCSLSRHLRADISSLESFGARELERADSGDKNVFNFLFSHTFDFDIPVNGFNTIKTLILKDAEQVFSKDCYVLQVEDSKGLGKFKCKCVLDDSATGLQIKTLKYNPLRHMVNDLLCLEKNYDLRFMLVTETYLKLSDEEKSSVNALVKAAVLDDSVKGGLRWPLDSSANRFKVKGVFKLHQTVVKRGEKSWKFTAAKRAEFEAFSERESYEVEFKDLKFQDFVSCNGCQIDAVVNLVSSTMDTADKFI